MATILIVDDYEANRDLVISLLNYKGHRALQAADGAEALAIVRAERPDLVISDILMPVMDGYEFVRQLRADPEVAATAVIFYTAHYHEREARNLAISCGVARVLAKPSDPDVILEAIEQTLSGGVPSIHAPEEQSFGREHLRVMTDKLSEKVAELQAANQQLAAVNDLNLQLASERSPRTLLERVCRSTRGLVGAQNVALCVRPTEEHPRDFCTFSGPGTEHVTPAECCAEAAPLQERLRSTPSFRDRTASDSAPDIGLPRGYPPVHSCVAASIASLGATFGWICATNKVGGEAFSPEDEHVLAILGAQVGRIYENSILFEQVGRLNAGLERRVAERTAELEAANRELEAFDYSISHDLRGPLGRIQGFSDAILEDFGAGLEPRSREYLEQIRKAGARMDELLGDLMKLSTITRGDIVRVQTDVSTIAHRVADALRAADPDRDVTVVITPGLTVRADPGLLRVVLENLIGNAWKFTSKRSGALIEVGREDGTNPPEFYVRDNGAGFDGTRASKLFEPFRRMHQQSEFKGTGIGLATVKRIVRRHGGQIRARSAPGEGASFHFTLPE